MLLEISVEDSNRLDFIETEYKVFLGPYNIVGSYSKDSKNKIVIDMNQVMPDYIRKQLEEYKK
jgi:hypothetical protein